MEEDENIITLPSGNAVYAHNLILGVGNDLRLYQGYDGQLSSADGSVDLSRDDTIAVARLMIDRLQRLIEAETKNQMTATTEKLDAMKAVKFTTVDLPPMIEPSQIGDVLDAMKTAPRDNPGEMG